jgi:hypothetical protein
MTADPSDLVARLREVSDRSKCDNWWQWLREAADALEAMARERDALRAALAEARAALRPLCFLNYPTLFNGDDGHCTPALICDTDVQRARAALAKEPPHG